MKARLCGDPSSTSPLFFEEFRKALGVSNEVRLGRRVVPVERIVSSLGRYRDFDQTFLPAEASVEERWKRIDRAFHCGQELPLVVLYKVGDAYLVEDGNHRVSVARYQGVQWIATRKWWECAAPYPRWSAVQPAERALTPLLEPIRTPCRGDSRV